jgi:hypothetical protein
MSNCILLEAALAPSLNFERAKLMGKSQVSREREQMRLHEEVHRLRLENELLRSQLAVLSRHPSLVHGMRGEQLVVERLGGRRMRHYHSPFDVQLSIGDRIEVKTCHTISTNPTRRWSWHSPRGTKAHPKEYDHLMLLGARDPLVRYEHDDPWEVFMVPHRMVSWIISTRSDRDNEQVWMPTNLLPREGPGSNLMNYRTSFTAALEVLDGSGVRDSQHRLSVEGS